ncbi:MAG: sulfatase-like hydrolase/transferase [Opitutaceae bacterium]|nr:sulfatase-like hydrolase/transferase [Opitutaceae bacterium]
MSFRLRRTVLLVSVVLFSFTRLLAADPPGAKRPNILFIFSDDQSYRTLGCYGGGPAWIRTPNIDRLAARGVRFERSYFGAWCMPSRASMLTGRLQHAVMSMTMVGRYPSSSYDPALCPFVPAQFRQQGYQTAQIGKWHTGTDTGYGRDWDYQVVWNRPGHPENAGNYYASQILTTDGVDQPVQGYSTDNYTDLAVDYINGRHRDPDKPWYLWLCYPAVHGPTTPAERHRGFFAGKSAPMPVDIFGPWPGKPAYLEKTKAWKPGRDGRPVMRTNEERKTSFDTVFAEKTYDSWIQQVNECMLALDEGVGRVLAAVEASGQLESTLVVFAADQGYGLGEHGFNHKVAPYDATVASPLIISWAGRIPAGKVCRHPVNAPDLIDLLCSTAGVGIPWKTHGRDIRPLLENPETTTWNSPMLMTNTGDSYGAETDVIPTDRRLTRIANIPWYVLLRDGRYKYVRYLIADEMEEIYDLETDPEELTNLAVLPEHQALLLKLRNRAIAELRRTEAKFVDHLPPTLAETSDSTGPLPD